MTQDERRRFLIQYLLREEPQYAHIAIPKTEVEQRQLLRGLMNIRLPKKIGEDFLSVQDAYLQTELKNKGITDAEILDAIRYHTSGKPEMSTLGKLIFVADMVEKGRTYDGVERLRKLFEGDFEVCFKECLKEEVLHLINKKSYIYSETLDAYDYYINGKQ